MHKLDTSFLTYPTRKDRVFYFKIDVFLTFAKSYFISKKYIEK